MNKINRLLFSSMILLWILSLTGCWNYDEVEDSAIVSGIAIDKGSDGKGYLVTTEIYNFSGGGKENKIESKRIAIEGKTLPDAVKNAVKISPKKLYWGHADIVIISQEVAKEGIVPVIDALIRAFEPRMQMNILVSKEKTAKEILENQSVTSSAAEIEKMIIADKKFLSKSPNIDIRKLLNTFSEDGIDLVLAAAGTVTNTMGTTTELSGAALFKGDKLIGFLDEEDTKYYLFIKNQIKEGTLIVSLDSEAAKSDVSLGIYKSKTKLKPVYINGKLIMNIKIKTSTSAWGLGSSDIVDEKGREIIKIKAEETLKENIESLIKKVKSQYKVDIFGFGLKVKQDMPRLWKQIEKNWDEIYQDIDINVEATVDIKDSKTLFKPIKIGE